MSHDLPPSVCTAEDIETAYCLWHSGREAEISADHWRAVFNTARAARGLSASLHTLRGAARELVGLLQDVVTGDEAPEGVKIVCQSTSLAEEVARRLTALEDAAEAVESDNP